MRPRRYRFALALSVCVLAAAVLAIGNLTSRSHERSIERSWALAQRSGSYRFSSEIAQTTLPGPSLSSVGQSPQRQRMQLDGRVNMREELVELQLRPLDRDGQVVELRIERGVASARVDGGPWQSMDTLDGSPAMQGDMLAYLAGVQDAALLDGGQDGARYRFEFDGGSFAASLREQLEGQLRRQGQLPPGVTVALADQYRALSGSGQIALDADQLPSQLSLNLEQPGAGGARVVSTISTSFSDFDRSALALPWYSELADQIVGVGWTPASLAPAGAQLALLLLLALAMLRLARSQSRRARLALSLALLLSMASGALQPLAQAEAAARISQSLNPQPATGEAPWDPQQDPLAAPAPAPAPAAVSAATGGIFSVRSTADTAADPNVDADKDGLNALYEQRLGTRDSAFDSDGDGIGDGTETKGYLDSYGTRWYLNPLDPDMDRDGFPDGAECPALAGNAVSSTATCHVSNSNTSGGGRVANPTRKPDLLNFDSDGDGVNDRDDLSPRSLAHAGGYLNSTAISSFNGNKPFKFNINEIQRSASGAPYPTFVDLQLRTTAPRNMTMAGGVLDWPTGDLNGQIQRLRDTTFADSLSPQQVAADPRSAYGDIRTTPLLELRMSGTQLPMPLANPQSVLQISGDFTATLTLSQSGTNISSFLQKPGLASYSYAIRKGSCLNPEGGNVKSWSGNTNQTLSAGAGKLLELANGLHHLRVSGLDGSACLPLYDLANGAYSDKMIDAAALSPYGITVRDLDTAGTIAVFVPLNTVSDSVGGLPVALSARIPYLPNATQQDGKPLNWGPNHEARLVWLVQMRADTCGDLPAGLTGLDARAWCWDPANRVEYDTTIQSYYDDWYLTGLSVTEDRGFDLAIAYERPAAETAQQRGVDDMLWALAGGLERTFLNGAFDVNTIRLRWDSVVNLGATSTQRWNIPQTALSVKQLHYATEDSMTRVMMEETPALLDSVFGPHRNAGGDSPTLLFARQGQQRGVSLDYLADSNAALSYADGALSVNLNPSSVLLQTTASLSWTPYRYRNGAWENYPLAEYMDKLGARLRTLGAFNPNLGSAELNSMVNDGLLSFARGAYQALARGTSLTVREGNTLTNSSRIATDASQAQRWATSLGSLGGVISQIAGDSAAEGLEIVQLEASMAGLTPAQLSALSPSNRGLVLFSGLRRGQADVGDLFTTDWMTKELPGYLHARPVYSPILAGAQVNVAAQVAEQMRPYMIAGRAALAIRQSMKIYEVIDDYGTVLAKYSQGATTTSLFTIGKTTYKLKQGTAWANKFSIAGAVLKVTGAWALAGVRLGLNAGSMSNYDIAKTVVDAYAATVVALVMLIIALIPGVGQVISAVIGLIDSITAIVCMAAVPNASKTPAGSWLCNGINGALTKALSWLLLGDPATSDLLGNLDSPERITIGDIKVNLTDPTKGIVVGSTLGYTIEFNNRITLGSPNNWMGKAYSWQFSHSNLRDASFNFNLQGDTTRPPEPSAGAQSGLWQDINGGLEQNHSDSFTITLKTAGINMKPPLFLNESFRIPTQDCISVLAVPICKLTSRGDSRDYEQSIELDILPNTFSGFVNTAGLGLGAYAPGWCRAMTSTTLCQAHRDADGDGLISPAFGGPDPNDGSWDASGAGLSDQVRINEGLSPAIADNDGDGLSDYDELWYGSDPRRVDSDIDGLTDKEELDGWMFGYDYLNGAALETRVTSDPLQADVDQDGLSDSQERVYGFHPREPSNSRVLSFSSQVRELTAPRALLRFEESAGATGFADSSGYNLSASCTPPNCPTAGVAGRYGSALQFSGNQGVTMPPPIGTSGDLSMHMLIRPDAGNTGGRLLMYTGHGGLRGFGLFSVNGVINILLGGVAFIPSNVSLTPSQWQAITIVRSAGSWRLYANGVQSSLSGSASPNPLVAGDLTSIGGGATGGSDSFYGLIDDVAFYDRALSAAEVATIGGGFFQRNDMIVPAGSTLSYQGQLTNELFNRYARGLLSTSLPAAVSGAVLPQSFVLSPQQQITLSGSVQVLANAPSGRISLEQIASAQITNPQADSTYADLWLRFEEFPGAQRILDYSQQLPPHDGSCSSACPAFSASGQGTGSTLFGKWATFNNSEVRASGLNLANRSFTISMWARRGSTGTDDIIVSQGSGSGNKTLHIGFHPDNRFTCGFWGGNDLNTPAYSDTAWHHWVCTYDASTRLRTIYKDQVKVAQDTASANYSGTGDLVIGNLPFGGRAFGGDIGDVRVFSRALSDQDIVGDFYLPNDDWKLREVRVPRLPFDEPPGASQFRNAGKGVVATCLTSTCPISGLGGRVGQALRFTGSTALKIGDIALGNNSFTVAFWAKRATLGSAQAIVSQANPATGGLYIGFRADNRLTCDYGGVALPAPVDTSTEWVHWACSAYGTTRLLYRNGALVASALNVAYAGGGDVVIGRTASDNTNFYNGLLDDLYIAPPLDGTGISQQMLSIVPLASMHFDEPAGSASFANVTGSPITCTTCPLAGQTGTIGSAASFDGRDDKLSLGNQLLLKGSFSFSAWVYPTRNPYNSNGVLLSQRFTDAGANVGPRLWVNGAGQLNFQIVNYINETGVVGPALPRDRWSHVVATYDNRLGGASAKTLRLFVNGLEVASKRNEFAQETDAASAPPLELGGALSFSNTSLSGISYNFAGKLDETSIHGYALSREEIAELYRYQVGWVEERQSFPVVIDTEVPTSTLHLAGSSSIYFPNEFRRHLIRTLDRTSSVERVELGVRPFVTFNTTWYEAPRCLDADGGIAWCPAFDPTTMLGGGRYDLFTRATDVAGNVETPGTPTTIYVDALPPQVTTSSNGQLTIAQHPTRAQAVTVRLNGTVSDISSGVARVSVTLIGSDGAIAGEGTQQASVAGNTWSLDYVFTSASPTGSYRVQVEAEDKVGLTSAAPERQVQIDATAPSTMFDPLWNSQQWGAYYAKLPASRVLQGVAKGAPRPGGLVHNVEGGYDFPVGFSGVHTPDELCGNNVGCTPNGLYGEAFSYDGSNGRPVRDSVATHLSTFSLAAWLKPSALAQGQGDVVARRDGAAYNYYLRLKPGTRRVEASLMAADCSTSASVEGASDLPLDSWSHVLASYDGATLRLYRNGLLEASQDVPLATLCQVNVHVRSGDGFVGMVDELYVFDHALLLEDVRGLASSQIAAPSSVELAVRPLAGSAFYEESQEATLRHHLRLDETPAPDGTLSVLDIDGTTAGTCNGALCPIAGQQGRNGSALRFEGRDQMLLSQIVPDPNNQSFSLGLWVNRDGDPRYRTQFNKYEQTIIGEKGGNGSYNLRMGFRQGHYDNFYCGVGILSAYVTQLGADYGWTHYLCTFNSSNDELKLYRNGALIETVGFGPISFYPPRQGLLLGHHEPRTSGPYDSRVGFIGQLDDLRYYNGVLSADQAVALYSGGPVQIDFETPGQASPGTIFSNSQGPGLSLTLATGTGDTAFKSAPGGLGNYAVSLDGVDDSLVGQGVDLINKSFTVAIRARRTRSGVVETLLSHGHAPNNQGLNLTFNAANQLVCGFQGNDLTYTTADTGTAWTHWACSYDSVSKRRTLYRNGVQVAQATASANFQGFGDFTLGRLAWQNSNYFKGALDDLRIYYRVLSAAEIREIAAQGWAAVSTTALAPGNGLASWSSQPPAGLEGFYQLDLRASDSYNNLSSGAQGKNVWRGEIDTTAPRMALSSSTTGSGSTQQTSYQIKLQDFNLDLQRVSLPCELSALRQRNFGDPWLSAFVGPSASRLYELAGSCTVAGPGGGIQLTDMGYFNGGNSPPFSWGGNHSQVVELVGNTLYVGNNSQLEAYSIANPGAPQFLGEFSMTYAEPQVRAISVAGNVAYVATTSGFFRINVGNPANMQALGGPIEPSGLDIKVVNNLIYYLSGNNNIRIYDLNTLDESGTPLHVYTPSSPGLHLQVVVNGATTLVYLTTEAGLQIINYTNPASPAVLGTLPIAGLDHFSRPSGQIVVSGNRAYIATQTGIQIVNITSSSSPSALGFYPNAYFVRGLALEGSKLYLGDDEGRLSLLDVSNASSPALVASALLPGAPAYSPAIVPGGGPIYVPKGASFTRIVRSGEASACDTFGNCASASSGASFDFDTAAGPREALVVSPAAGTILTSLNPVSVTLSAHADSGIATLALTANGASVASTTPGGSPTDQTWQTLWTPSGAGDHLLRAVVTDTGTLAFTSPPVTITVDLAAPTLDFASTTITTSRSLGGLVILDGSLADESGVASMVMEIDDGASSTIITPTASLDAWSAAWPVSDTGALNGVNVTTVLTATDMAGRVAVITRTLLVDVEAPTALGVAVTGNATPLTPGAIVAPGTTLTASSSGPDDPGASIAYSWASGDGLGAAITTTVGVSVTPAEPARMTAQLWVRDALGNTRVQELGPFYVDGPRTPDYLALDGADGMYQGWRSQGCTLMGSDRRIAQATGGGAALSAEQRLWVSWSSGTISPALRLAWSGADWSRDGDLFVYLDTKPGGALAAHNPYAGDSAKLYMPGITPENVRAVSPTAPAASAMRADYALWVTSPLSATLLRWSGSAWVVDSTLDSTAYRFTEALDGGRADLLLEFSRLGIVTPGSNPLGLLAFASQDDALRLWAALPASNPLSSARLGHAGDGAPFALTQRYQWSALGSNVCPNGSQGATTRYADAALDLALTASPLGMSYSYLGDQLTSLWANLLSAQGPDRGALVSRLGTTSAPLGDGAVISYTLRYRNEGTQAAQGLVAIVEASHALRLPGGALSQTLILGTLAPGQALSVSFTAEVDTAAARTASYNPCVALNPTTPQVCEIWISLARASLRIYDSSSSAAAPLERLWSDHAVDDQAPVFFNIVDPEVNIGTGVVTMTGYAYDPSGVPTVTLQIRPTRYLIPGVGDTTIVCPDPTPFDGRWSCSWDPVALNGGVAPSQDDEYYYITQVTDGLGHQSAPYPSIFNTALLVDTTAPTMTLNALSTQVVGGDTLEVSGLISDNRQLEGLDVCVGAQCVAAEVVVTLDQVSTVVMSDTQATPLPISGSLGACPSGVGIERSFVVTQGSGVWRTRVALSLTHPARDELTVSLITRNNQQIVLLHDDGLASTGAQNYHVLLDDSAELAASDWLANDAISETARVSRPYQPLRRARGESMQGTWKLRICDNNPGANQGSYRDGTLELHSWEVMPALAGSWTARVPLQEGQDYVGRTLAVTAYDKAGNRSATLNQTLQVDNVLPLLTSTQIATTAAISRSTTVLTGTVSDGSPLEAVLVLVRDPSGTTFSDRAPVVGGSWSYALLPRLRGSYEIIVLAGDAAGNVSSSSSIVVQATLGNQRWLPMIRRR